MGDGKSFSGQRSRQLIYLPNTSPFRSDFLVFLAALTFHYAVTKSMNCSSFLRS
jgi:hypothetical protein